MLLNYYSDLTVIIQGPVHRDKTCQVITSVRKFLPGAEIIVSTWPDQDLVGIEYDNLVINQDPGALPANNSIEKPLFNNLSRQIVTTVNGLRASTRTYAIKLRSDCIMTSPVDYSVIDDRPRFEGYVAFKKPIVILNLYTRNPLKRPVLFHYSDIYMFGLRDDLLSYWSAPLPDEPQFTRWLEKRRRPFIYPFPEQFYQFRCAPEQYLGHNAAKLIFPMRELDHMADGNLGLLINSIRFLANNFLVLSPHTAGVMLPERMMSCQSDSDLYQEYDDANMLPFRRKKLPILVLLKCSVSYCMAIFHNSFLKYYFVRVKSLVIRCLRKILKLLKSIKVN